MVMQLRFTWANRAILAVLVLRLPPARQRGMLVTTGTNLGWHRRLSPGGGPPRRIGHPGRPSTPTGLRALVKRLASRTRHSEYRRIHGELAVPGHRIGGPTVWAMLKAEGLDPAHADLVRAGRSC
jgi:putative transposase